MHRMINAVGTLIFNVNSSEIVAQSIVYVAAPVSILFGDPEYNLPNSPDYVR